MAGQDDKDNIPDSSHLLRRIPKLHFIKDENLNSYRPSSAAFDNGKNGSPMSVRAEALLLKQGHSLQSVIDGHVDFALARLDAGFLRNLEQIIYLDEVAEEPAHALVEGLKTRSTRKKIGKHARWAIPPNNEEKP